MSDIARGAPDQIRTLLAAVEDARAEVATQRMAGNEATSSRARARLHDALESYADALAGRGATLPHELRVELNLYRSLYPERRARPGSSRSR